MLATDPAALSRRAALAAALVVVATGCDLDPRGPEPAAPTPTAGAPSGVGDENDLRILDEVRVATTVLFATVMDARRKFPALRAGLRPLVALHRAHAIALDDAGRTGAQEVTTPIVLDGDTRSVLDQLRTEEARLQRRLAAWSMRAGSGGFARLLASMSAGVAAHLAALPGDP